MTKHFVLFVLVILAGLPFLGGCNIYAPIAGDGDPMETALSCLHDGDYNCAVEAYNRLPDGELKQQKLCTVRMAQAGFSLSALIDIFNNAEAQGATVLGAFANALLPYTAEKQTGAEEAVTACAAYNTTVSSGTDEQRNFGLLLRSLSLFLDCAIRIAKTDTLVAVANGSTECSNPGNGDGKITADDIGPTDGDLSGGTPGMCAADVVQCALDVEALDGTSLDNSDLEGLSEALQNAPNDLKSSLNGETLIRAAIRQTTTP